VQNATGEKLCIAADTGMYHADTPRHADAQGSLFRETKQRRGYEVRQHSSSRNPFFGGRTGFPYSLITLCEIFLKISRHLF
jgi:hypothetical protein